IGFTRSSSAVHGPEPLKKVQCAILKPKTWRADFPTVTRRKLGGTVLQQHPLPRPAKAGREGEGREWAAATLSFASTVQGPSTQPFDRRMRRRPLPTLSLSASPGERRTLDLAQVAQADDL